MIGEPRDCPKCGGTGMTKIAMDPATWSVIECRVCAGCGWIGENQIVDVSDELHKILGDALAGRIGEQGSE